jgi:hypothetical protein
VCNMQAAMWESSILICSSVVPNLAATSPYIQGYGSRVTTHSLRGALVQAVLLFVLE